MNGIFGSLRGYMGFKGRKSIFSLIFFEHTKWIILFELLTYERTTFQQNLEHEICIKKYWKLNRWEVVSGDPLEKSILAVARITRDNFIRNKKKKKFC